MPSSSCEDAADGRALVGLGFGRCPHGHRRGLHPGIFFLGFSVGAVLTGLVLLAGGPFAAWLGASLPFTLLFFALLSLISWIVLRRVVGVRKGQLKVWDRDINED